MTFYQLSIIEIGYHLLSIIYKNDPHRKLKNMSQITNNQFVT